MGRPKVALAVMLGLVSGLRAEITHTYAVKADAIGQVIPQGITKSDQPLKETKLSPLPKGVTSFVLLQITAKDKKTENSLKDLESSGALIELSQDEIITDYVRGEIITTRTHKQINSLPEFPQPVISTKPALSEPGKETQP